MAKTRYRNSKRKRKSVLLSRKRSTRRKKSIRGRHRRHRKHRKHKARTKRRNRVSRRKSSMINQRLVRSGVRRQQTGGALLNDDLNKDLKRCGILAKTTAIDASSGFGSLHVGEVIDEIDFAAPQAIKYNITAHKPLPLGAQVAIKVTLRGTDSEVGEREIAALKHIMEKSPLSVNVIQMFASGVKVGLDQEIPPSFIVLEYLTGGDLMQLLQHVKGKKQWLRARPLTSLTKWWIIIQILSGVAALHQIGCVHLDLKPENILISDWREGRCVITDFGFADVGENQKLENIRDVLGTAQYGAPEILNPPYDGRLVDLYACGVIAYTINNLRDCFSWRGSGGIVRWRGNPAEFKRKTQGTMDDIAKKQELLKSNEADFQKFYDVNALACVLMNVNPKHRVGVENAIGGESGPPPSEAAEWIIKNYTWFQPQPESELEQKLHMEAMNWTDTAKRVEEEKETLAKAAAEKAAAEKAAAEKAAAEKASV